MQVKIALFFKKKNKLEKSMTAKPALQKNAFKKKIYWTEGKTPTRPQEKINHVRIIVK